MGNLCKAWWPHLLLDPPKCPSSPKLILTIFLFQNLTTHNHVNTTYVRKNSFVPTLLMFTSTHCFIPSPVALFFACTRNKIGIVLFCASLCLSKYLMLSRHNLADAGRFGKPLGELCDVTNNYSLFSPLELKEPLRPRKMDKTHW